MAILCISAAAATAAAACSTRFEAKEGTQPERTQVLELWLEARTH